MAEIEKPTLIESDDLNKEIEEILEDEILEEPAEAIPEKAPVQKTLNSVGGWEPKTKLGIDVKAGKIRDIDEILQSNKKILEAEIVDTLLTLTSDLISIGQSKGKFGGGKRRAWRQTQRKTMQRNVPTFSTFAVVGDENGHIGVGMGRAAETLPAREKSIRKAKLNIMKIRRTCGAFDCSCSEPHTIPFEVRGKAGSVRVILTPAPQGTGLVVGNELKKVLKLAGIKDMYSKTFGQKRTSFNLVKACIEALKKTNRSAIGHTHRQEGGFKK